MAIASLEDGERKVSHLRSMNKEDPVESHVIGRINYLHPDGRVRESVEYTSEYQFEKYIKEEHSVGVSISVTLYHERRMPEFLAEMADKYGIDRVKIVLASTIQLAEHDGRYYPSTKADAAKVHIPSTDTEDYSTEA